MKTKERAGITLIALVVTVVVLLILAGISINLVLGQNGIITKAGNAKKEMKLSEIKESVGMAWEACEMDSKVENDKEYFTEDNLNAKITDGNISDLIYGEESSFMVYHAKDGTKYNVEITGDDIIVNKDTADTNDLKNWDKCTDCSEENPHIIRNKYEFESIRTHINVDEDGNEYIGGYFKLAENIYFYNSDFEEGGDFYNNGNGFIPIGLKDGPYNNIWKNDVYNVKVNFDGNNKEIANIKISTQEGLRNYNAIFARLDNCSKVENLNINNLVVYAPTSIGSIARAIYSGAEVNNITLKNSKLTAYKSLGQMASSGLIAGYIEGKVYNINIYNCDFVSKSWYGGGITGNISYLADVDGITMDKCNVETYVEGGMIFGTAGEGLHVKNIKIQNSSYTYTHSDSKRGGFLVCYQSKENQENPVIFERLDIKNVTYNKNVKNLISNGYCKLIDSNIQLVAEENTEISKDNIVLENSIIGN